MSRMEAKEMILMYPEDQGRIQDDTTLQNSVRNLQNPAGDGSVLLYTAVYTRTLDVNKLQLIFTMFYLSSLPNLTPQFCYGSYSSHIDGRSCSNSFTNEEESQKMHWRLNFSEM